MKHYTQIYIDGGWIEPSTDCRKEIINPYTEEAFATTAQGGSSDVDRAVKAARRAFKDYSRTSVAERVALIDRIIDVYQARCGEFAELIAKEVGIPVSAKAQVNGPIEHMKVARDLLKGYAFESRIGTTIIRREPIGVCALISPWNWPIQTPVIKIVYALVAGCTMVVKPSEASPISSILLTEVLDEAGVPAGVFNLVLGRGSEIGDAMTRHPEVDMVSFTGSTRAGSLVASVAAQTIKRTCLELGGKSANVVLRDADLEAAARWNINRCFFNSGQSCHAPSLMLVHKSQMQQVLPFLEDETSKFVLGDPNDPDTTMGPLVNHSQFKSVQRHIQSGIDEGARLVIGGVDRPEGINRGYFVQPTIFADVHPDMTICREEIFGPVLAVVPYETEEQAVEISNSSVYGLGGYVFSGDAEKGHAVANQLRAGRICFNGVPTNSITSMGGYKQSGIGRSMGVFGLEEYLEVKSIYGFGDQIGDLVELPH